jgi:acyl carrier protein
MPSRDHAESRSATLARIARELSDAERIHARVQQWRREAKRAAAASVEGEIATLWSESLGVRDPSPAGNFFALGGHSLLLAQLAARVSERLGVRLPLPELFQEPTLARLCALVRERLAASEARP